MVAAARESVVDVPSVLLAWGIRLRVCTNVAKAGHLAMRQKLVKAKLLDYWLRAYVIGSYQTPRVGTLKSKAQTTLRSRRQGLLTTVERLVSGGRWRMICL